MPSASLRSSWRGRWKRRLAWAFGAVFFVWIALVILPLPVGWLFRAGLERATVGTELKAGIDGATLRWRLGEPGLQLELRNPHAELRGVPLFKAGRVRLELAKHALFDHRVPPVDVSVETPELTLDVRAEGRLSTLAPVAPGARAILPEGWERHLPRVGEIFRMRWENGKIAVLTDDGPWKAAFAHAGVTLGRSGPDVALQLDWISDGGGWRGRVSARGHPGNGRMEFVAKTEAGVARWPGLPPVSVSAVELKGGAEAFGRSWWAEVAEGSLQVAGVGVSKLRLDTFLGPRPEVGWSFVAVGSTVDVLPQLGQAESGMTRGLRRVREVSVRSDGRVTLETGAQGQWRSRALRARIEAQARTDADEQVGVNLVAAQREGAEIIQTTGTLIGLNPEKLLGPYAPDVGLDAGWQAAWSREGRLLDGRMEIRTTAAGRLRIGAGREVPLDEGLLRLRADMGRREFVVETARLRSGSAHMELQEARAHIADDGAWEAGAKLTAEAMPVGAWLGGVPALAGTKAAGLEINGLVVKTAELALNLRKPGGVDWRGIQGTTAGAARLIWGKADFGLKAIAERGSATGAVNAKIEIAGLRPALLPIVGRPVWAGLDLPVDAVAEAQMDVNKLALLGAHLGLKAGPGAVRTFEGDAGLALKETRMDAALGADGHVSVSAVRIECADAPIWAEVGPIKAWSAEGGWRCDGRAAWGDMAAGDVFKAWPEGWAADSKATARASFRAGMLDAGGLVFSARTGRGLTGLKILERSEGVVVLHDLALEFPNGAGEAHVKKAELQINYPSARLSWERVSAGELRSAQGRVDLSSLDGRARADWSTSVQMGLNGGNNQPGKEEPELRDKICGDFEISGKGVAPLDSSGAGARVDVRFEGRDTRIGQWIEGAIAGEVNAEIIQSDRWRVLALMDISKAKCRIPDKAFGRGGFELPGPAPARAVLSAEKNAGGWTLQAVADGDQLMGRPWGVRARATLAVGDGALRRVNLDELRWGGSSMAGEYIANPDTATWKLDVKRLRIDEIWQSALPSLTAWIACPAAIKPSPARNDADDTPTGPKWSGVWHAEEVFFGEKAVLQDVDVSLTGLATRVDKIALSAGFPEGPDRLHVEYGKAGPGMIEILVPNMRSFLGVVSAPLRQSKEKVSGSLANLTSELVHVYDLIGGGTLRLSGNVDPVRKRFEGEVAVRDAILNDAPGIVKLLALRSGKAMGEAPFIERLKIDRLEASPVAVTLAKLTLKGAGLVDHLALEKASYRIADEAIVADGSYWGVGFEVAGTRSVPQVFMKNNLLIRAIGQNAEADFDPR